MNELLSVEDTLAVTAGRTWHAFHVEGCGGGHWPDTLALTGRERHPHVLDHADDAVRHACRGRAPRNGAGRARARARARARRHGDRAPSRAPRNDGRRGPAARPRGDLDALERLSGHGPRGRGRAPRLPERRRDARAARSRRGRPTTSASSATSRRSRSTPPSRTGWRGTSARSSRASWQTSCSGFPHFFGVRPELVLKSGRRRRTAPRAKAMRRTGFSEPLLLRRQVGGTGAAPALLSLAFMARRRDGRRPADDARARRASRAAAI